MYTTMTAATYPSNRTKLLSLATTMPGSRRKEVLELMSKAGDAAYYDVHFGRQGVVMRADGTVAVSPTPAKVVVEGEVDPQAEAPKEGFPEANSVTEGLEGFPGAAYLNYSFGGANIPCGVVLILGVGGTGKTPLAHALAMRSPSGQYGVVRAGEPMSGYRSGHRGIATDLAQAMYDHSAVVVDSIKDLLSSGGSLMKSGLSRTALVTVSAWSTLANDLGVTLFVPVNASTDDADVATMLQEAARSNATMVIVKTKGEVWEYFGRQGEGLNRTTGTLSLSFQRDSTPVVNAKASPNAVDERSVAASILLHGSDWSRAMRNATVHSNES